MPSLPPDLYASEAAYEKSPLGGVRITRATNPCGIFGVTGLPELDFSVVEIRVTRLGFELSDVTTSLEQISLVAAAKILARNADKGAELELKLCSDMSDHLAEINFVAQSLKSIVDIAKAILVDTNEVEKMLVPLTKK